MSFCEVCKINFANHSRLKVHRADFHQEKLVISESRGLKVWDISRDSSGAWYCPCSHRESGDGCTQRMRRHGKSCKVLSQKFLATVTPLPKGSDGDQSEDHAKTLHALNSAVKGIQDRLEMSLSCSLDPNDRCVDAFILKTKWHKTIGCLDPELVEAYVSGPSTLDPQEIAIYKSCRLFLEQAGELERTTPFLVLRFLGPQADGSRPGRDPFRTVQEAITLGRYADYLGRLVLMVWRRVQVERFKIMPAIRQSLSEAVKNLGLSLSCLLKESLLSSEVQKALRVVLKEIFCVILPASCQRDDQVVAQFSMFRNFSMKRGWAGPEEAGHTAAALCYACRCVILCRIREEQPCNEDTKVLFKLVSTDMNTPFCALQDLMRIAAYIQATEWSAGLKVVWSTEHPVWTTLALGPNLLNLNDFADGLKELCSEASRILRRDLLLNMPLNEEEWESISRDMTENLRETRIGHSLFHRRANSKLAEMQGRLVLRICNLPSIYGEFFFNKTQQTGEVLLWKKERLHSWFRKVESFQDCLIPLVHILGGGPARAEELATLALLNTETGMRNLYWMHNTVMLITTYHKSQNMTGRGRPVARFLPTVVANLVLKYVALIKPFESVAAGVLYGGKAAEEAHRIYLFAKKGKRMNGQGICSSFTLSMHKIVDFGLKISEYRHVYTLAAKRLFASYSEEEGSLPFHEQAAHSAETGEYVYGISSSDHHKITANRILLFWRCSNEWQSFLHFADSKREWDAPARLGKRARKAATLGESNGADPTKATSLFSLRATHRSRMSEILDEWRGDRDRVSEKYFQGSKRSLSEAISSSELGPSESGRLLAGLRRFLENQSASFLSKFQIYATREVLKGRNDLLIVMPTGSGKSLTYMLPIWLETCETRGPARTTVVVVPLVALMRDIRRRCEGRGIPVGEWAERERSPVVLLVSVELTECTSFQNYVGMLAAKGRLARIVVEEAHVRITWERFRPKLRAMGVMRPATGVPLILLTGTLPPRLETDMAIKFGSPFLTIRMPTSRHNLSYRVIYLDEQGSSDGPYARSHVHASVLRVLRKYQEILKEESSRAIVYCATRSECTAILQKIRSSWFSVSSYHRGMESEEREASDFSWRSGQSKIMVATSAFGTGIDFPGVRLVVHVGHSSSMLDYAQETGRAGRDGELSVCVTIAHKQYSLGLIRRDMKAGDLIDEARLAKIEENCVFPEEASEREQSYRRGLSEFLQFIAPSEDGELLKCRRQELQIYLDGGGDNCLSCGADFARCDVCEEIAADAGESSSSIGVKIPRALASQQGSSISQIFPVRRGANSKSVSLRELPSQLVRDAGMATQRRRSQLEEAISKAGQAACALGDFCVLCSVMNGKLLQHQSRRECTEGRRRCLRCYAAHSVRECNIPFLGRRGNNACYKCGVRHRGTWGKECTSGLEHARSALLAVWHCKREWLNTNFGECTGIGSLEAYDKWLYQETGDYEPIKLIVVFNKWWAVFHSEMD